MTPITRAAGYWSSLSALFFSCCYIVAQFAEWLGWLGSSGGPHAMSTPLGIFVLLTPSLLLGPSFLLAMLSLHDATPPERRLWTHAASAFAIIYTTMIAINYYVQLAWVGPRMAAGRVAGMEPFLFVPFDSFLYAVDILGYSFMSLATMFAAFALPAGAARWFFLANGLILPCLLFQMFWHELIWLASAWVVTFPGSMWTLARFFDAVPHPRHGMLEADEYRDALSPGWREGTGAH